jgi:glycyl-tRNA synthetase
MFGTKLGASADTAMDLYLRPERHKVFFNLNVQKIRKNESSFGIAQTGKAFRNEIVARQFILECANSNKWKCILCVQERK